MYEENLLFLTTHFCISTRVFPQISKEDKFKQLRKIRPPNDSLPSVDNGSTTVVINGKTKYTDFKVISLSKDTTYRYDAEHTKTLYVQFWEKGSL